jgi:hypothetical protein
VEESGVRLLGVLCPMRAEILTINQAKVPSAASLTQQKQSKIETKRDQSLHSGSTDSREGVEHCLSASQGEANANSQMTLEEKSQQKENTIKYRNAPPHRYRRV